MSFYRKYRPQTFEDVMGQSHVAQTLGNALSSEPLRISHAYLFCGPRGTGKTTTARILAKCLNCEKGPTATPCNECDFCLRVQENQPVMDLIEIDAASNTQVEKIRDHIIDKVNMAPAQGRYRVYIIDEVHMLSTSSFNALLKTLEEPPPHAIFILATTDAHKVPVTVTSRCQRYDFRRVTLGDIEIRLNYVAGKEGIELDAGAARLIARSADGALRDALSLLEQVAAYSPQSIGEDDVRMVLGTVSRELLASLLDAVAAGDGAAVLAQLDNAVAEGASFSQLAKDLTHYCRDLLLLTVGYQDKSTFDDSGNQQQQAQAQALGRDRLLGMVDALRTAEKDMRQSTDHRLLLELTLVRAASNLLNAPRQTATAVARPAMQKTPVPITPPQPASQPVASAPPATPKTEGPLPSQPAKATEPVATAPVESSAPVETASTDPAPAKPRASGKPGKGRRIHDLNEFLELWPYVLLRIRKKISIPAVAYLHDAIPVELNDKAAILEFQKQFHYEKACEAAKNLPFENVINECMAAPHQLVFRLAEPKAAPAPEPPPVEKAPVDDEDDEDEDDVFKMAQQMLGAEVVEEI